ncbi:MAG: hypothetical protein M4579_004140 [Chaenotheca gracillima]|nr:MAG: hypothetical protein M4579_004140 [Chaenotheca gracillima]
MSSGWKPLARSLNTNAGPPLLVKYEFLLDSYNVSITDLVLLWRESVGARDIIDRALDDDTSIEPGEDSTQMAILFEKLKSALHGDAGTSAIVSLQNPGDDLRLDISASLPAPLQPLKWTFHLSLTQPEGFTDEFLLPVLERQIADKSLISSLFEHLRQKDAVIDKFIDKIGASGIDLNMIFPAAAHLKAPKGGPSRDSVSKFVKGLDSFDEAKFKEHSRHGHQDEMDVGASVAMLFGSVEDESFHNITRIRRQNRGSLGLLSEQSNQPKLEHAPRTERDQPAEASAADEANKPTETRSNISLDLVTRNGKGGKSLPEQDLTAEEKADHKRVELKHELEGKGKIAQKKKRKF